MGTEKKVREEGIPSPQTPITQNITLWDPIDNDGKGRGGDMLFN